MRKNQLGYDILSEEMFKRIFGNLDTSYLDSIDYDKIKEEMRTFGVNFPINQSSPPVADFIVPQLRGDTISEHFSTISNSLCEQILSKIQEFIKKDTQYPLEYINYNVADLCEYWNRIDFDGSITQVESPLEDIFVFDCETFVKGSTFGHPIIGSAVSSEAYYLWIHPCLLSGQDYEPTLISIGSDKIIIAHNASFDKVRVTESYQLTDSNVWLDTMSMHINVSGLASGQRFWFTQESTNFSPTWSKHGALNNLVDCYNFHCLPLTNLQKSAKNDRNIFVHADHIREIVLQLPHLLQYALKDAYYTQCLFYSLFPKYHQANPSLTTLVGHTTLMRSFLPLHDDWDSWVQRCEQLWANCLEKQTQLLSTIALELLEAFRNDEIDTQTDPWLSQMDWEVNSKVTKTGKPASKWYGYPNWVRDIAKVGSDRSLIISKITTKQQISHLLLRLKWDGNPIIHSKSLGWCFFNQQTQALERIPHPKEQDANVGNLITKDFLAEFESGLISSDLPQAQELLDLSIAISYWTSVRSRVAEVNYETPEGFLAHSAQVVPHNTSTNRAGCNLWFTVPGVKKEKIGSEIKTMCRAPQGWKFVQSDYDSQEVMIASVFADSYHHVAGSSAFSFSVLAGNKSEGTDMHSVTARQGNIPRDVAKNVNYALTE